MYLQWKFAWGNIMTMMIFWNIVTCQVKESNTTLRYIFMAVGCTATQLQDDKWNHFLKILPHLFLLNWSVHRGNTTIQ